jgi:hypothetical protein
MPKGATSSNPAFKTRLWHRRIGYFLRVLAGRPAGWRAVPTLAAFPPEPGVTPDPRPPVRIFIGAEPGQNRAERVLVWSILKHRDPARAYEVYLMKDLAGFARRYWKTGFTNYRYAIPAFASGHGRAIYNDADQVYLTDPAALFDQPMGDAGVLSIDDRETSVMLLDAARMGKVWPKELAQENQAMHREFRSRAAAIPGLWGQMPAEWNARDSEYQQGQSKLLHFTALHTQPWKPFPNEFRYGDHAAADIWRDLEAEADAAGFTIFTATRPSPHYQALLDLHAQMHVDGDAGAGIQPADMFSGVQLPKRAAEISELITAHNAQTVLDYGAGKGAAYEPVAGRADDPSWGMLPDWGDGVAVRLFDPGFAPLSAEPSGVFDGVISNDVLEHIPEEDIPWTLDQMFRRAKSFVYVVAACYPARKTLSNGLNAHVTVLPPAWWQQEVEAAARRTPGIAWVLRCRQKGLLKSDVLYRSD